MNFLDFVGVFFFWRGKAFLVKKTQLFNPSWRNSCNMYMHDTVHGIQSIPIPSDLAYPLPVPIECDSC